MNTRIIDVRELTVPLAGGMANALVDFSGHTTSIVAVVVEEHPRGRPVIGFSFGSIGRFAQGGLLRERIIPRVLAADPSEFLDPVTGELAPEAVLAVAMRGEKPGGHGDRSVALAALELAVWDAKAKLAGEPAHVTISRCFGTAGHSDGVPVYAAGGYYRPGVGPEELEDEFRRLLDQGFTDFKMKIGGATLRHDLERIEAVLGVAGDGARLRVDANGRFDGDTALRYADAMGSYGLRWFEEPGEPLDFELNRAVIEHYPGPVATGENLFSVTEVANLARYGGMRPGSDVFQMDPGLSYGLTEYVRMMELLEARGFGRAALQPHGGHSLNLHIVAGLGLGACEAYAAVFAPVGGFADDCVLVDGRVHPGDAPGFGLEQKRELAPYIAHLSG